MPSIMMLGIKFAIIGIVWLGGVRVNIGRLTSGQVIAFINYCTSIASAMLAISRVIIVYTRTGASIKRIKEIFETQNSISSPARPIALNLENGAEIEFKNVSFSFSDAKDVVKNLSIKVAPGETIGIIGGTGSGKSSVVNLIPRFYDPTKGKVILNGKDLRRYDVQALRERIGIVPQNPTLFKGTIRDNMRWHKSDATDDEIIRALIIAQAYEFVKAMPDFLDSKVERGGTNFSGGQRQRIGLARAMIMEPSLVVADEPISALDVSIRAQVLNLLNKFQRERGTTYLFIAHDLSIVRFISDRIGVIYKGEIVEIAEAEELFAYPLHPYTRSLISAIPIPDPKLEKKKKLFVYDPSQHDYSEDKPEMVCIGHNHYIFGNKKEIEEYKRIREEGVPLKSSSFMTEQEALEYAEKEAEEPNVSNEPILETPVHDTGSTWFKVLSFFLPIPGIIAAYIFKKFNYIKNFKAFKKGSIAGFIFLGAVILLFLFFLLLTLR